MVDPFLIWLHLVPQLLVAVALLSSGAWFWARNRRTPLVHALAILLIFRGHLSLVSAVAWLPEATSLMVRLWPVFDVAVVAAAFAVVVFALDHHFTPRRLDTLLSSIIGGGAALSGLFLLVPDVFWGNSGALGPGALLEGLRIVLWGTLGWLFLHRYLRPRAATGALSPRATYLFSLAFLLPAIHWLVTDLLFIRALSIASVDLSATIDHQGRLLVAVPILLVCGELLFAMRRHPEAAVRANCRRYLVIGLLPALTTVLLINLILLGWVGSGAAGLAVASTFDGLWTMALPVMILLDLRGRAARTPRGHQSSVASDRERPVDG